MIVNIQVLRAVAAMLVVCFHILVNWQHNQAGTYPVWLNPSIGAAGVDLFFVISGFIMLETTRDGKTGPVSFLRKRLIRIAPLYWLLVIALAARSYHADPFHFDMRWLAQSLLFLPHISDNMTNATFPESYFPILFVGWTLTFEMLFYSIFAFALAFRATRYWSLIVPGLFLSIMAAAGWMQNSYLDYYGHPIILEFLYGMAIATFVPKASLRLDGALFGGLMLAMGIAGLVLTNLYADDIEPRRTLLYGLSSAAVVYGATHLERHGYAIKNRTVLAIGAASYSLYLIHPIVLSKTERLFSILPSTHFLTVLLVYLCTLVCITLLALVCYRYFERPAQRYLTRLLKGRPADEMTGFKIARPNQPQPEPAD